MIPAFSFGEVVTCTCDQSENTESLDAPGAVCAQDHLGNYLDPGVLPALCAAITDNNAETGCEAVRPVKNTKITSCKWCAASLSCPDTAIPRGLTSELCWSQEPNRC